MLVARDVEVRAGARLLLEHASFQVAPGDKIGLVGRNGAGKTTLTRICPAKRNRLAERSPERAQWDICRRIRGPAILMCSPRTGSCPPAAWTLSLIGVAPSWQWGTTRPMFATRQWRRTRARRPSWRLLVAMPRKPRPPESPAISAAERAAPADRNSLGRSAAPR